MAEILTAFLASIGSVVTFLTGQFGGILSLIVNNAVLVVIFSIFVCGAIIGLVTRLYRRA